MTTQTPTTIGYIRVCVCSNALCVCVCMYACVCNVVCVCVCVLAYLLAYLLAYFAVLCFAWLCLAWLCLAWLCLALLCLALHGHAMQSARRGPATRLKQHVNKTHVLGFRFGNPYFVLRGSQLQLVRHPPKVARGASTRRVATARHTTQTKCSRRPRFLIPFWKFTFFPLGIRK